MPPKRKAPPDAPATVAWAEQTVSVLKKELERRGLPQAGRKAELVARLDANDTAAAAAAAAQETEAHATHWPDQTVASIKEELERRGLPKGGKKADLLARLQADIDSPPSAASDPPPRAKKSKTKDVSPDAELDAPAAEDVMDFQSQGRTGEVRARPFVSAPDDEYRKKFKKVKKERMFMLDRTKITDNGGVVAEIYDIAGSTGNIYQTTIGRSPKCTCMDARIRGQKCKHIYYALIVILKAPAHLCYQNAFLTDEIEGIFAIAPITRAPEPDQSHAHAHAEESYDGKRKPIDGDCPICVFEMSADEDLVWCKASCGQNFHADCFAQWKRSRTGQRVTCVYCRAQWQEDGAPPGSMQSLKETAPKVGSYRNIGHLPMYQQSKK